MNKNQKFLLTLVAALVLFTFSTPAFSRGALREKIMEQWLKKKYTQESSGADDYRFTLEHGGLARKYNVHLPSGYNNKNPLPLVIYLHGGGGTMKAAYEDGLDKDSDKFGFILAVPDGTGIFPNRLHTWNGGKWDGGDCCGSAFKNNVDDVGFISAMIDELEKKFNVDDKRIYATGISNGAIMSYRLACELSERIAAVAAVAPPAVPNPCPFFGSVSIMQINGTADPAVPFNGGKGGGIIGKNFMAQSAQGIINFWLKGNDCAASQSVTYQKGDAACITYGPCGGGAEVVLCKIEGGGHTWPSGKQYMPESKVGPVSYDLSFDQIWEFFRNHYKK